MQVYLNLKKQRKIDRVIDILKRANINYDTDTIVSVHNDKIGLYISIKRDKKVIEQKFIKSFNELNTFKKMIKCLG